jgi:hypothetical protein
MQGAAASFWPPELVVRKSVVALYSPYFPQIECHSTTFLVTFFCRRS